ncbi:uncharacterized protein LOC133885769 [Phragmites australis]|uniref:uncharacterized protein LOC133885769 n=1 Tax=Phragmites australis TaxID=29695 RepID=UPI002D76EDD6|nr:uncharacterized protein LOC133885769 [Phragmites australis]
MEAPLVTLADDVPEKRAGLQPSYHAPRILNTLLLPAQMGRGLEALLAAAALASLLPYPSPKNKGRRPWSHLLLCAPGRRPAPLKPLPTCHHQPRLLLLAVLEERVPFLLVALLPTPVLLLLRKRLFLATSCLPILVAGKSSASYSKSCVFEMMPKGM